MLIKAGLITFGVYTLMVVALFAFQRRILFVPDPNRVLPSQIGLSEAEVVTTRTADGMVLEGWWLPPSPGQPVVLYLQGNGGSIAGRADKALQLQGRGYGVLLAGYRGYGGNPGAPSEEGLISDGAAWLDLLAGMEIPQERTILYGESLGTGVAVALAQDREPAAVVLEAPFASVRSLAERRYWFVPVRWLIRDPFDSLARIPAVRSPVLVVHGSEDGLIPLEDGRRIYEAATAIKDMVIIEGGGHSDLMDHGALDAVDSFLIDNQILTQNR